jgi:hypothetical protein
MFPTIVFTGTFGPGLASWLFAHADELGDAFGRFSRPVLDSLAGRNASVDRIGSALVAHQDGQAQVLGLLHRHTTKLDGISAAVDGIGAGQQALAHSLDLLTSLSMVGLGVSVLAQVHLAFQFAALTRRINTIDANVRAIKEMLVQAHRANLNTGLGGLRIADELADADPSSSRHYLFESQKQLTGSRSLYTEQLVDRLASSKPAEPEYQWLLAQHLTTAGLGEAACHLRLGQPKQAIDALRLTAATLTRHASAVFNRTVAADPARYLIPATAAHGLTLEVMAELYRQAGHAGVLQDRQSVTAANLFEAFRANLAGASDPRFWKASKVASLRSEFAEASAAVEEVNRVKGLALAIEHCHNSRQDYQQLAEQIQREIRVRTPEEGTCFAVFPNFGTAVSTA